MALETGVGLSCSEEVLRLDGGLAAVLGHGLLRQLGEMCSSVLKNLCSDLFEWRPVRT